MFFVQPAISSQLLNLICPYASGVRFLDYYLLQSCSLLLTGSSVEIVLAFLAQMNQDVRLFEALAEYALPYLCLQPPGGHGSVRAPQFFLPIRPIVLEFTEVATVLRKKSKATWLRLVSTKGPFYRETRTVFEVTSRVVNLPSTTIDT